MSITYPITQFSIIKILNCWPEPKDIFIVGTGSSLTSFDFNCLFDKFTITLNDAALHVPNPNIVMHADPKLCEHYKNQHFPAHTIIVCQPPATAIYHRYNGRIHVYTYIETENPDISKDDAQLYRGIPDNGGFTVATPAISLAWKLNAQRIFLLGIDCYCRNSGKENEKYYLTGKNPSDTIHNYNEIEGTDRHEQQRHTAWIEDMLELRSFFDHVGVYNDVYPGSNVYNLSADSGITAFEKVDVEEALNHAI